MSEINEKLSFEVIKTLRKKKLSQGIPFMINSDKLHPSQCYLEFPDGLIKIAEADFKHCDFTIVYEFSLKDSKRLRRQLKLI